VLDLTARAAQLSQFGITVMNSLNAQNHKRRNAAGMSKGFGIYGVFAKVIQKKGEKYAYN